MAHEEYLRRNLIHAGSVGAVAGVRVALKRLTARRDAPKWLVKQLRGVASRLEPVPHEIAEWRNIAPDAPSLHRFVITEKEKQ